MMKTDVVVVGAGPGGAAASIYLSQKGIKSIIIEKESFPRYHIGESLTGEVGQRIRDLGLKDYMIEANHPKKFGVNVYGPRGNHTFRIPVMARSDEGILAPAQTWQVSREEFDKKMLDEASSLGAHTISGKAVGVIKDGNKVCGVRVKDEQGEEISIESKVVVDASGGSTFLNGCGLTGEKHRGNYDNQVAIYSQVAGGIRNVDGEKDNTLILYRQRNHWAWFIPINDDVVSVGVVVPSEYFKDKNESREEFFLREVHEINPELKRRIPEIKLLEKVRASSNYSYAIDRFAGNGFLCVGDSHRFIDPVFSFGLHLAVHEAELASQEIEKFIKSDEAMSENTFDEYQKTCNLGLDTIQELVDAFWNNPHAFAYAAHFKHKDDIIDLFAGRIYRENPSQGLIALQKINEAAREKVA